MKHSQSLSLLLVFTLTISGLIIIESANAQTITKPSVPEFTLKVISHSNDLAPTNLEITVKNQPFRFKGHFSDVWSYYPENRSSSYAKASLSDYTTISFDLGGPPLGNVPSGGIVDFQVQALIGHDNLENNQYQFTGRDKRLE